MWAAIAATVAGSVLQAKSTLDQGKFAKQMGEYNAAVAQNEAILAKQTAEVEEERHRDNLRRFVAGQRARTTGVQVDEGSAGLLVEESIVEGERDALAIRYAGTVQAARSMAEAAAERFRGRAAMHSARLGAAGQLLSGTGKAIAMGAS
jgi:hypothetical protein